MSIIRPFKAVRPAVEKAQQVSCVPYDVAHESEVRDFIQDNPESFLRVTRAEAEFNGNGSPETNHVFDRAKENLQRFLERAKGQIGSDGSGATYLPGDLVTWMLPGQSAAHRHCVRSVRGGFEPTTDHSQHRCRARRGRYAVRVSDYGALQISGAMRARFGIT